MARLGHHSLRPIRYAVLKVDTPSDTKFAWSAKHFGLRQSGTADQGCLAFFAPRAKNAKHKRKKRSALPQANGQNNCTAM